MTPEIFERLRTVFEQGIPREVVAAAIRENEWFTEASIDTALKAICEKMLDKAALEAWIAGYPFPVHRNVGVIMAGNIPFVGFYDLLAVLLSGAACYVKTASKDRVLMGWVIEQLRKVAPQVKLYDFDASVKLDAVIATGSDNSNRYFGSKYGTGKLLSRGSRFSVAVLSPSTTDAQLIALWSDLFTHYGLGCRNVSHLFLPEGFAAQRIVEVWEKAGLQIDFEKYKNNYTYTKAEKVMNGEPFIDGGYFLLTEKTPSFNALSEISFSFYRSAEALTTLIDRLDDKIQCVVADKWPHPRAAAFGAAQFPALTDYPDSKNVLAFLAESNF